MSTTRKALNAPTKPPAAASKRRRIAATTRAGDAPWLAGLDATELTELHRAVASARERAWGKARADPDPFRAWTFANPEAFHEAMQPRSNPVGNGSPEHQRRCKGIVARGGLVGRSTATRAALRAFESWHLQSLLSAFEPRDPKLRRKAGLATLGGVEPAVQGVAEWLSVRRAASIIRDHAKRKTDPSALPVGADADAAAQRFARLCLDDAAALVWLAEDSIEDVQELLADDATTRRRASVEMLHAALERSPAEVARLLVESLSWRSPPCPTFLRKRGVRAADDSVPESIIDLIKADLKRLPWEQDWRRVRATFKRYWTLAESLGHLAQGETRRRLAVVDEEHEREVARLRGMTAAEVHAEARVRVPQLEREMDALLDERKRGAAARG